MIGGVLSRTRSRSSGKTPTQASMAEHMLRKEAFITLFSEGLQPTIFSKLSCCKPLAQLLSVAHSQPHHLHSD